MKVDTTKILLIIIILFLGWHTFIKTEPQPEPVPVTITIPETSGTTGKVTFEEVDKDTVYLKGNTEYIEVDKGYKELYEKAKDSLEKTELYYEAIKIREYDSTIVDNDDITIMGTARTRGSLLDYSVDYTIKEKEHTYTPEVITQLPRLTAGIGGELTIPTMVGSPFELRAKVSLMNQKGHEINLGYDTGNRFSVGYTWNFKLIK